MGSNVGKVSNSVKMDQEVSTKIKHPDFPEYVMKADRLLSFACWPATMMQTGEQLSNAGFFYTQRGDWVKCFCCGGGLRDWHESDDPWEEHATWFSKCEYLRLIKGERFVDKVKAKKMAEVLDRRKKAEKKLAQAVKQLEKNEKVSKKKHSDCKLCKICYVNEYNVAFLPCGHVAACSKCAELLKKCPICQELYDEIKQVFFS